MMLKFFVSIIILFSLIGCAKKHVHELKSPCVAVEPVEGSNSPCARRFPSMNQLT